jgi:hypothetical protein
VTYLGVVGVMGVLVPRRLCQNDVQQVFTKQAKKTQSLAIPRKNNRPTPLFFFFFLLGAWAAIYNSRPTIPQSPKGPPKKKKKKTRDKKTIPKNNRPTFLLFFSFFF